MKLAEALIERSDLQKTIAQIKSRMKENVKIQEGDVPTEIIDDLLPMYESLMDKLENLVIKINKTNSQTAFEGLTLAEAITKRDSLKSKISSYKELRSEASITRDRYSRNEIKFIRCVDIAKLQNTIDSLSKMYRELDTKIQGLNWTADLI